LSRLAVLLDNDVCCVTTDYLFRSFQTFQLTLNTQKH